MRLFAAVSLPAGAAEAIAARVDRSAWPEASWVRPANLHLTLAFFGETAADAVAALATAAAAELAAIPAFRARVEGAGAFPERGPIRVVWLGVEPAGEVGRLAEAVRRAAATTGVEFDPKPFRSHLTLARCRRPWPSARRAELARLAPGAAVELDVRAAALLSSEPGSAGPRYVERAGLPLGRAA